MLFQKCEIGRYFKFLSIYFSVLCCFRFSIEMYLTILFNSTPKCIGQSERRIVNYANTISVLCREIILVTNRRVHSINFNKRQLQNRRTFARLNFISNNTLFLSLRCLRELCVTTNVINSLNF